jgi:hypothetical protein
MPVAAVPTGKLFQWIMMLEYLQSILHDKTAQWNVSGVTSQNQPQMIHKELEDMLTFMYMSYSNYSDWLGMTSPFIEHFLSNAPQVVPSGAHTSSAATAGSVE